MPNLRLSTVALAAALAVAFAIYPPRTATHAEEKR